MMSDFIRQDVNTYFYENWDAEGQAIYDYFAKEFPGFEDGYEDLRGLTKISTCRMNDTLFVVYAIEWLDEQGTNTYPICFDTGHIVYDTSSGKIVRAEHTNKSSIDWGAYDFRMSPSDCEWWVAREEESALR